MRGDSAAPAETADGSGKAGRGRSAPCPRCARLRDGDPLGARPGMRAATLTLAVNLAICMVFWLAVGFGLGYWAGS